MKINGCLLLSLKICNSYPFFLNFIPAMYDDGVFRQATVIAIVICSVAGILFYLDYNMKAT